MEALGINLPGLITQIVSFGILFAILYRLLYKPLLGTLDRRSGRIRESLEAAQSARDDAARSQEEMQGQLAAARAEGQQLIAQAREVADRFREEELANARAEIGAERTRAQANIQRERDLAIEELRREFAGAGYYRGPSASSTGRWTSPSIRELIEGVLEEGSEISRN